MISNIMISTGNLTKAEVFFDAFLGLFGAKKTIQKYTPLIYIEIFIMGIFNFDDADVLVKYRNNKFSDEFQSGWNIHSIHTIEKNLELLSMEIKGY